MMPTRHDSEFPAIAPQSATAAYRADLAGRAGAFGQHDGAWVTVASLLEHAALLDEPDRGRLVIDAIEFSREVIGDEDLARIGQREWQDRDRTPVEAIILMAENVHRAEALNLAGVIFDALLVADTTLNDVQRGRIMVHRARVLRKMGLLEEADGYSRHVARLGRRARSPELLIRALLGYSATAQMRGNYPRVHHYSRRALRLAEWAGIDNMVRDSRAAMMIALGAARQFDEALIAGWKAYQASLGDSVGEGEILGNIGQLLLESGHYAEARAGFAAVVSGQQPAHILLPALGGLAIASAMTGHPEMVEWAAAEVARFATSPALRYPIASALLEAAIGLQRIGRAAAADRCRTAAIELGRAHNFHEVVFRAEAMAAKSAAETEVIPQLFTTEAATVANEVAWLEPKRLPEHVDLAVASS